MQHNQGESSKICYFSVKNVVNVLGKELISEDMPWSTLERSLLSVNNVANVLAAKDT